MTIERMDKQAAQDLSYEIRKALTAALEPLGVSVEMGGGRYDPEVGTYTPRITISLGGSEQRAFALMAYQFGLSADDYGKELTVGGMQVKVVGLNSRARRMPLIVEGPDGSKRKCVINAAVLRQLGHEVTRVGPNAELVS